MSDADDLIVKVANFKPATELYNGKYPDPCLCSICKHNLPNSVNYGKGGHFCADCMNICMYRGPNRLNKK